MAKRKIVWTQKANLERKETLEYWLDKNKSKTYSTRLNNLILEQLRLIAVFPFIGKKTNFKNTRTLIVQNYLIFYEFDNKQIKVLSFWDGRRRGNNIFQN